MVWPMALDVSADTEPTVMGPPGVPHAERTTRRSPFFAERAEWTVLFYELVAGPVRERTSSPLPRPPIQPPPGRLVEQVQVVQVDGETHPGLRRQTGAGAEDAGGEFGVAQRQDQ